MGPLGARAVRWGILGTGRIAQEFAGCLKRVDGAELVAIASRDATRAASFGRAQGVERAYGSYEALVAADDVDVVYVATPNTVHHEHSLLALAAGKAVLCEKPFATNARRAREVAALARQKHLFCMEAMWTLFTPLLWRARELVNDGAIGEPLALDASFGVVAARDGRAFRRELGGGSLLDLGVYLVALARFFLGPSIRATAFAKLGPEGVDEQASALLEHRDGRQSLLFASLISETVADATLFGTRGRLKLHAPFYRPHRLSVTRHTADPHRAAAQTGAPAAWRRKLRDLYWRFEDSLSHLVHPPALQLFQPVSGSGYEYEAAEVVRCLQAGEIESPRLMLAESVEIVQTLDNLRELCGVELPGD